MGELARRSTPVDFDDLILAQEVRARVSAWQSPALVLALHAPGEGACRGVPCNFTPWCTHNESESAALS